MGSWLNKKDCGHGFFSAFFRVSSHQTLEPWTWPHRLQSWEKMQVCPLQITRSVVFRYSTVNLIDSPLPTPRPITLKILSIFCIYITSNRLPFSESQLCRDGAGRLFSLSPSLWPYCQVYFRDLILVTLTWKWWNQGLKNILLRYSLSPKSTSWSHETASWLSSINFYIVEA